MLLHSLISFYLISSLLSFPVASGFANPEHGEISSGDLRRRHARSLIRKRNNGKARRCTVRPSSSTQDQIVVPATTSSTLTTAISTLPFRAAQIATTIQTTTAKFTTFTTSNLPTSKPQAATTITSTSQSVPLVNQPSTSASGGSEGEYLQWHNTARRQHDAADLTWSNTLASAAQSWAKGCVFEHSGGEVGPYGENLAAGSGSNYSIKDAVTAWTDEVVQYNAASPSASHYTQVVWRATTQVGCAMIECTSIFPGSTARFHVCEYSPAGNVIGQFSDNVH